MAITASISNAYSNNSFNYSLNGTSCTNNGVCSKGQSDTSDSANATGNRELSDEEKQQVQELQTRDREVRAHEMAHVAAGGQYVRGGANLEYQTGPDGKRYAVGGEVSIDTSKVSNDPEATIRKMQVVKRAALAPAKPSPQDRSVAAQATQKEMQARQEQREEKSAEKSNTSSDNNMSLTKTASYTKNGITISSPGPSTSHLFDVIA